MLRFFEVLAVVTFLGATWGASRAVWLSPGDVVRNVPKNVRSNHASYRTHYRHIIGRGGK